MNEISPFSDLNQFAPPPERESNGDLGQEDFLKLMVTQFQNQDPFEPLDNGDFLGQLAQFSTVNGITSLNDSFAGLAGSLQGEQVLQAANLVGHTVLASNDIGFLPTDGSIAGAVELRSSASNVQVEITDANGQLVQRLELGQQAPGMSRFEWDGRNADGDRAPEGQYLVTTRVLRGTQVESAETLLESEIESVSLGRFGQGMTLNLPGGTTMSLAQVRRII
jgi:flagellar basal-body rod modification protein FlgD